MVSKICLLTLAKSNTVALLKAKEQIGDLVSDFFSDARLAADFTERRELLECLNSQLEDIHTAIIAAEPSQFLSLKLALLNGLSLRAVRNRSISEMTANMQLSQRDSDLQVAMPEKAKVFLTQDGLYSGFAVKCGSHCLILLPLDCHMLDYMVAADLTDFLGSLATVSKRIESREEVEASVIGTVERLANAGVLIGVSGIGSSQLLLNCLGRSPRCYEVFVPDSLDTPKLNEGDDLNNYVAVSAREAKENTLTKVGIAVSDVIEDDNGASHVIVSIANSERARVVNVFSEPHDDKKAIILASVNTLLGMLDEFADEPTLVNPTVKPRKKLKIGTKPLIIVAVCLIVAIAACVGIVLKTISGDSQSSTAKELQYGNPPVGNQAQAADIDETDFGIGGNPIFDLEDGSDLEAFNAQTLAQVLTTKGNVTVPGTTVTSLVTAAVTTAVTTVKETVTTVKATTTAATTTAKPTTAATTTEKPTTAKPETTTAKQHTTTTEKAVTTSSKAVSGTFTFTVRGYGHGVGMSQDGAIAMAKDGMSYQQIVLHYYTNTRLLADSATPVLIKYGGRAIPIVEYLCRTVAAEIGPSAPKEALKAQACTAYTYAKYYNFDVGSSRHAYKSDYKYHGTAVETAVNEYLGITGELFNVPIAPYIAYNGEAVFACYFANSAGHTASAESVWGGNKHPYLSGGVASPEKISVTTVTVSAQEMKERILADNPSAELSDNPAKWLKIESAGQSGYVNYINVGGKTMRGNHFREKVMGYSIRSHSFTFVYEP